MNFLLSSLKFSALMAVTALAGSASFAQSFNPTQPALGFNVFAKSNLTFEGAEVDGALFTGADLVLNGNSTIGGHTSGAYPYNTSGAYPYSSGDARNVALAVTGKVIYGSGNGNSYINNGLLRIGNLLGATDLNRTTLFDRDPNNAATNLRAVKAGNFSSSPAIQVQRQQVAYTSTNPDRAAQSPGIDTQAAFDQFTASAQKINGLSAGGSCTKPVNNVVIPAGQNPHITLVSGKTNVITLTPSGLAALNSRGSIIFDQTPSASAPLVINVSSNGADYTMNDFTMFNAANVSGDSSNFILWNFYNATSLNISGNEMYGTVFAPKATVTKPGSNNLNGQIISNQFKTGTTGEIHEHPFTPELPTCGNPLPVTLVSFTGQNVASHAVLHWSTATEVNSLRFEIQSSVDGQNFVNAGSVPVSNSVSRQSYSFTDTHALAAGNNYYRLNTVDTDGKSAFSPVISIRAVLMAAPSQLFPNPAQAGGIINVQSTLEQVTTLDLVILDMSGRAVSAHQSVQAPAGVSNSLQLTAPNSAGVYILKITTDRGTETTRFIVR